MTALYKKLLAMSLICIAIISCSYEDKTQINTLTNQLSECRTQSKNDTAMYDKAWAKQTKEYDSLVSLNHQLYDYIDKNGTGLDKAAKLFAIYPTQTIVISLFLLIILIITSYISIRFFLGWREDTKYKHAKIIIETAKEARQAVLIASRELSHTQAQKIALLSELDGLNQYQNIDELKEKEKIINEAIETADRIHEESTTKINNKIKEMQAQIDQKWKEINQKEQELQKKEKELEADRQAMIHG
ncbi:MAG: hypothetical protein K2X95_02195 [Flavobacteriaceae bacterium]|nr:hypothetical protein [Flavobacteriaceae bacterium]